MKTVQLFSVVVYGLIAIWYLVPRIKRLSRADALTFILWPHVFRYCVIYLFTAQKEGYAVSDTAMMQLVVGDLVGAAIAVTAIYFLRKRLGFGITLSWLLIVATVTDMIIGTHQRMIEPPRSDATGVWFMIFAFFAPIIMVSLPLMIWQLYSRRGETL